MAAHTIIEATSWMDWWMFAARSMALSSSRDAYKVRHLFAAEAHCQLLVTKTASTVWANLLLKRYNAVWPKSNITPHSSPLWICVTFLLLGRRIFSLRMQLKRQLSNVAMYCMMRRFLKLSCGTNLLRSLRKDCSSHSQQNIRSLLSA